MKYAAPVRKKLAVRTIFNYLGPLTNPSFPAKQMIGVYSTKFLEKYARAVQTLRFERVLVYSSEDGMDEVSPSSRTIVYEVEGDAMSSFTIDAEEFITQTEAERIPRGCTAEENARLFVETISSSRVTPLGKFIALNSALGMYAHAKGNIKEYYQHALDIVHGGEAKRKVEELKHGVTAAV
jgi:anthranilate phosphoribosyltransferase